MYEYFALKGANEAVNEGMSAMIDFHAGGRRNLCHGKYKQETFIHANGPPLCNAEPVLRAALDKHFGKEWHFRPSSREGRAALDKRGQLSAVLKRKTEEQCKLPLLMGKCKRHCAACALPFISTINN